MCEFETFHETYETKSMKLRNPWNHETHEITKPRTYEKFSRNRSLDETYYYETCETCENHETFKITKLMKPWNVETMTLTKI